MCRLGVLQAGVGHAGGAEDPGAGMVWAKGSARVHSTEWSSTRVVKTEPTAVLTTRPAPVRIIVLHSVHTGGLLLHHVNISPGEWAGHGGAEKHINTEHHKEEDTKDNA